MRKRDAQEGLVKQVKSAEASKQASQYTADQLIIEAEAQRAAAEKEMQATKMLAEAKVADQAAPGLAEAKVTEVKAGALEKEGTAQANVIQKKAEAQAKGDEAMAVAIEKQGTAEATVLQQKATAEAKGEEAKSVAIEKVGSAEANVLQQKLMAEAAGIEEMANAMKLFDAVGKDHEEFKLRLNKDKDIEIAAINAQQGIADAQSRIVGEALKSSRIDIVGGETQFFEQIISAVKAGKSVDRFVYNSEALTDIKNTFFNGNPDYFREKLHDFASQFGMSFEDVKDLSIAALIGKMLTLSDSDETRSELQRMLDVVKGTGLANQTVKALGLKIADGAGAAQDGNSK